MKKSEFAHYSEYTEDGALFKLYSLHTSPDDIIISRPLETGITVAVAFECGEKYNSDKTRVAAQLLHTSQMVVVKLLVNECGYRYAVKGYRERMSDYKDDFAAVYGSDTRSDLEAVEPPHRNEDDRDIHPAWTELPPNLLPVGNLIVHTDTGSSVFPVFKTEHHIVSEEEWQKMLKEDRERRANTAAHQGEPIDEAANEIADTVNGTLGKDNDMEYLKFLRTSQDFHQQMAESVAKMTDDEFMKKCRSWYSDEADREERCKNNLANYRKALGAGKQDYSGWRFSELAREFRKRELPILSGITETMRKILIFDDEHPSVGEKDKVIAYAFSQTREDLRAEMLKLSGAIEYPGPDSLGTADGDIIVPEPSRYQPQPIPHGLREIPELLNSNSGTAHISGTLGQRDEDNIHHASNRFDQLMTAEIARCCPESLADVDGPPGSSWGQETEAGDYFKQLTDGEEKDDWFKWFWIVLIVVVFTLLTICGFVWLASQG